MQTPATIHLQGVGKVKAIMASQLHVGMRLLWNYGATSTVVAIRECSPKFLEIDEQTSRDGTIWTRRLKKERLVAGYWPKQTQ